MKFFMAEIIVGLMKLHIKGTSPRKFTPTPGIQEAFYALRAAEFGMS